MRNQYTECNKPKWVKLEFEMLTFYKLRLTPFPKCKVEDDQSWLLALGRGLARTKSADPEEVLASSSSRLPSPHVRPWLLAMNILKIFRWGALARTVVYSWCPETTRRTTRRHAWRRQRGSVPFIWRIWPNSNEFILPRVHQSFVLSPSL